MFDEPPPAPYVTVTELLKLNGLVVLTVVPPPPEKFPPTPPVKEPRLMSVLPLKEEKAVIVPLVVPPIPVEMPAFNPDGLLKPSSVKVRVNEPAPVCVKTKESKSRVAIDAVPGALDVPPVMEVTHELIPVLPDRKMPPVALV